MCYYTLHGHLQIDNNGIENAIRPIVLGRKNYLFAGTHQTAQNAAMVYEFDIQAFAGVEAGGIFSKCWTETHNA